MQQQKTKRQLLQQRLDRLRKNSQSIIQRMDNQINSIQEVKNDLDAKSQKMNQCMDRLKLALMSSAGEMYSLFKPLGGPMEGVAPPKKESIAFVCNKIMNAKSVCVLTGAGVSKNSGIPTFRGPNGLYSKNIALRTGTNQQNKQQIVQCSPEQQFLRIATYEKYPSQIWEWCKQMQDMVQTKQPNKQHILINELCSSLVQSNIKVQLVTTNVDSLHHRVLEESKSQTKYPLHEIHGNFRKTLCFNCHRQYPAGQSYLGFKCWGCGSQKLRPFVMMFDEKYDEVFDKHNLRQQQFDMAIVVGTSLQTGLSIKLVYSSKCVVEINPICVLKTGQVYQFQKQCDQVLGQLMAQIRKIQGKKTVGNEIKQK